MSVSYSLGAELSEIPGGVQQGRRDTLYVRNGISNF